MLVEGSEEKVTDHLSMLAGERACFQNRSGDKVRWQNTDGHTEAMFFIFRNFPSMNDYISIYHQIKSVKCPVTFLFQRAQPGVFDIFRFSARSFIEHHNQLR